MIYLMRVEGRVVYVEGPERADFQAFAVAKFEAFRDEWEAGPRAVKEWEARAPQMPKFDPTRTDGREARRMKREYEAALAAYVAANPKPGFAALSLSDFIEKHLAPEGYKRVQVEAVCLTEQDEYGDDDYGYDD